MSPTRFFQAFLSRASKRLFLSPGTLNRVPRIFADGVLIQNIFLGKITPRTSPHNQSSRQSLDTTLRLRSTPTQPSAIIHEKLLLPAFCVNVRITKRFRGAATCVVRCLHHIAPLLPNDIINTTGVSVLIFHYAVTNSETE